MCCLHNNLMQVQIPSKQVHLFIGYSVVFSICASVNYASSASQKIGEMNGSNAAGLLQMEENIIPILHKEEEEDDDDDESTIAGHSVNKGACKSEINNTIVFHGENSLESAYIHTYPSGSIVMTPLPEIKTEVSNEVFTTRADVLEASKKFSSTTFIDKADNQHNVEVTTVLGLDEPGGPEESLLEIPLAVDTSQPVVIASTDSLGNCYVTLQEDKVINSEKEITRVPKLSRGTRGFVKCGRSRMIADKFTSIPVAEFKAQLNDTSDIMGKFALAPPTRKAMEQLQCKGLTKVFATPGRRISSPVLMQSFTRHLKTRIVPSEETFHDMTLLPVGYQPEVDPSKIKRITRRRRYPEAEEYQRRMMQQTFDNLVAQSQKNMEAVFLENTGSLGQHTPDNVQVLVETANNVSFPQNASERVTEMYGNGEMNDNSIIVIQDDQETAQGSAYTQRNIEVLLAAAAESGIHQENIHQVIICQHGSASDSFLPGNGSIIIVPNDALMDTVTETVMTS